MKEIRICRNRPCLSPIGLGTVNAGIAWDHEDAFRIFRDYLAAGGNLIDTAHVYSDWIPGETARSERRRGWDPEPREKRGFHPYDQGRPSQE